MMQRRRFLLGTGAAVAGLSIVPSALADTSAGGIVLPGPLAPIDASPDRIIAVSVCSRPFRAQGPRIESERVGRKTIVHNYGHGGSGWSLSWGSGTAAVHLARAASERDVAVVGCGAIGLTTAVLAQRAGMRVRIYAREFPPAVHSNFATGVWSPDSRICTAEHATAEFERRWESLARTSFHTFQTLLGLPGHPIQWRHRYALRLSGQGAASHHAAGEPSYPTLERRLLADLTPLPQAVAEGRHPFIAAQVTRIPMLVFNVSAYSNFLLQTFLSAGGQLEAREFSSPSEFSRIPEKVVVNATGYGARALLGDESVVPVRGQTARLIPQPEVDYGIECREYNLYTVPRTDGILVQAQGPGDYGNADVAPDRDQSVAAVQRLASLYR